MKNIRLSLPHQHQAQTTMLSITSTPEWRSAHPGSIFGLLELSGVDNTRPSPILDQRKRETEASLRARYQGFTRQDFISLLIMAAYQRYYKRFDKTYHVLLQLESIVLKNKNLPDVSPLVDSNFTAEVDTLILTAGHDVDKLQGALTLDVSRAGDLITRMNGIPKAMEAGDMVMRDLTGVVCSLIYGQDNVSPITPATTRALYVAYVPAGIPAAAVESQLQKIAEHVRLFCSSAVVEQCQILAA
jgi:DNA/RNA-binding domain of Phe-tRNA-synthetase-like protein